MAAPSTRHFVQLLSLTPPAPLAAPTGKFVLGDVSVVINGVDLSDHANQIEINDEREPIEFREFGQTYKQYEQGPGDVTITIRLFQDYAIGSVHRTLRPIFDAGSAVPITIKRLSTIAGTTNPEFSMVGHLMGYSPLAGAVGEPATLEAVFRNADDTWAMN